MKSRFILAVIFTLFLTTSISFGYKATFLPSLSVMSQYTDNVLLTENKDLKEHDVITTIHPAFTAELIGKDGDAKLSYDPSYAIYDKFNEFNGWRHQAKFFANYEIAKNTSLSAKDKFLYTEDPLRSDSVAIDRTEDPTLPIDFTERKTRRIYTTNFASVALNHQFGKYQSFRLGYAHRLLNNDDPAFQDKQRHTPWAGLSYWFGPKWGFDVNGSYTRGEFEVSNDVDIYRGSVSLLKRFGKHFIGHIRYSHTLVENEGESEKDQTYVPSIGFQYDIEKDISLIADIGYFYNDYVSRPDKTNVNGDLRLIKLLEHGKINFAVLGGYDYAYFGNETLGFAVFVEGSVSVSHQIGKHVYGHVRGSYRNTEYTDSSDRKDKRPRIGLGLTWQALEWMNVALNYRFSSVDSTIDTNDYDDNSVFVSITLTPKVPFHTSRY